MKKTISTILTSLTAAAMIAGCSKSSSSDAASGTTTLSISGTLGQALQLSSMATGDNGAFAISLTDLQLYAICLSSPPAIASSAVAADGSFNVSLPCPTGSLVTALFQTISSLTTVGQIYFEDSTKKSLDGSASKSTSVALAGNVNFGNITLTDGGVTIPVSSISSSIAAPTVTAPTTDLTGTYKLTAVESSVIPTGYTTACALNDRKCNGPMDGMYIYLKAVNGLGFTPDATCQALVDGNTFNPASSACAGTTGTDTKTFVQFWNASTMVTSGTLVTGVTNSGSTAYTTCGSRIGFRKEVLKAFAGIDLDAAITAGSIGDGAHSYDGTYTDGWKAPGATAKWPGYSCLPISITDAGLLTYLGKTGSVQGSACQQWDDKGTQNGTFNAAEDTYFYSINVGQGGGCVLTGTNTPVQNQNWSGGSYNPITIGGGSAFTNAGTQTYTNHDHDNDATTSPVNITCTHIGRNVVSSTPGAIGGTPDDTQAYTQSGAWRMAASYAQGATCSGIGNALEKAKCYASAGNDGPGDVSVCTKKMFFDWGATSEANFAKEAQPQMSANEFAIGLTFVAPSGDIMIETAPEERVEQIQNGDSYVNCRVETNTKFVLTTQSSTRMLANMTDTYRIKDTNPACLTSDKFAPTRQVFYMDKQ